MSSAYPARILTINSGSSSLKFALMDAQDGREVRLMHGAAERIGDASAFTWLELADHERRESRAELPDHRAALESVFASVAQAQLPLPDAIGHRLVHGGPQHVAPVRIDADLVASLRAMIPFAPLHLPAEILGIEAAMDRFGQLPQAATFDTAFHARLPELARRLALPAWCDEQGIRRYGFHGLSYEYIAWTLGAELAERTVIAHLGNGSSLVALLRGVPIDTSMGLTPCGGVMMGTRSGDLDPGVLTFLANQGHTTERIARLVNQESGLLGVSGRTADMQSLLAIAADDRAASLAVEMFCYQLRKTIGAYAAALGGIELLVFTGGIGAHAASVREAVCGGLQHLGIILDPERNRRSEQDIGAAEARCRVRAISTDEELMIARHTREVLQRHGG